MNEQLDTAGAVAAYLNPTNANPDPAQGARVGVSVGLGANPDYEAELKQVARRTGVPVDTVRAYPDELKRQAQMGAIDFNGLAERFPRTAGFLTGVENAKIAHDDIENMGLIETLVNSFKRGAPALRSMAPTLELVNQSAGLNTYRKIDERIAAGEDPKAVLSEYGDYGLAPLPWHNSEQALAGWNAFKARAVSAMQARAGEAAADVTRFQAERNAIPLPSVVERTMAAKTWGDALGQIGTDLLRFIAAIGPESLVQTAPGLLAAIPAGIAGGPLGSAATIGGNSAIVDYASSLVEAMQGAGIDVTNPDAIRTALKDPEVLSKIVEQAGKHAAVVGAFDALSGGIAGKMVLPKTVAGKLAGRPLAQEMANIAMQVPVQATLGAAGEAGGELYSGQDLQPGNILAEAFGEFFGTPGEVVLASAKRIYKKIQAAREAEATAVHLQQLDELAKASKVRARDADTFESFVKSATEDGPLQDVFIDAKTLMQSGMAEQVAAALPSVAAQLSDALATGGDIKIPVAEYASRLAGTEYSQGLLDHLKTEPNGMSRAEAQEFMQSQAEVLKAEVEHALAEKQGDEQFKAQAEAVKTQVREQLDQVARFTGPVNDAYASMVSNFYAVMAAKLGIAPQELFARYPLKVAAENVAGDRVLEQSAFDLAVSLESEFPGLKLDLSGRPGKPWVLSRIVVPEGERGAGTGTQVMSRILETADAQGATVALTPSSDFGGNKKRLVEFYKRFGFVENKGRNKDYEVSESMYRPARTLAQNKGGARGAFNPSTNTITLFKNADLSTFLHESGHFFLETQFDIAAKIGQEAAIFGADTNKPGEAQILKDTQALLKWFGVESLQEWYGLDFEQKRSYHEQFARGFEAYLFEGKAPSIELQGLFQRFRAWLLNVYRELKNLNVELTDEVRSVFDRMLATTDEIKLAEQGRSMMPLFATPEQAGMTPEEFAAYQALGVGATNDAIQDVQARGLRDLAWTRNARGREIQRLQREAAAKRAEVMMEVRREVMSQPIYRAWQFLTGKITAEDKIEPNAPLPKSSPDSVDAEIDSLLPAIAKLGGISRESAAQHLGVHEDYHRTPSGVFGKPAFRKQGGKSADGMAEALAELGYLPTDEHGKHDVRDLEHRLAEELNGNPQYAYAHDYSQAQGGQRAGEGVNLEALGAGRFDLAELKSMGLPPEIVERIQNFKMTAKNGIHPDLVAELFGFSSGDELVRTLAAREAPKAEIEGLTDQRMLERYGELATPAAIERAADKAIHNEARARFVATEANALAKATGSPKILASAARDFARAMIARLKTRDIRPGQYAAAEVRAAKAAEKASKGGDLAQAAAEKRNQLVNTFATRAAYDAQEEVDKGLRYLKKFDSEGVRKALDADYADQIDALLERFDLRKQSQKAIDKRTALAEWIKSQREQGLEPDIPAQLENEAFRKSYRDMTVEEFRGLVDTVKQIEHLGRLKNRLLTAADNRAFGAVRDEIAASIEKNAGDRIADTRTPTTNLGRALQTMKRFYASHIKAATWARVMDGGKDGGPMWEYFVRSANERGDMETTMRAEATAKLSEALAPVFALGKMGGNGQYFPTIDRSLNREARLAIALNWGNEGNRQRLLGGEGWTPQQIAPVLQSLTASEWAAVQQVWDHFENYRPRIAAKERRIYGKEPDWVAPTPFSVLTRDGGKIDMRGGYYPIKYDPAASQRAEEHADAEGVKRQLQGAYTSATTRRSFTKSRAEEVSGRPLLYTLAGLYSGVNDVIHDLAWHEWLIDANRLLRSKTIDNAIRTHYGPEAKAQFKSWANDIAEGEKGADNAGELALSRLRQGVSAAGLGFNVMSALMQPLGLTQSVVRVGAPWIGRGVARYLASPLGSAREVNSKSEFMANRARTRFREINELRNQVQDQSATKELIGRYAYFLMMRCQQMADTPTWIGAYEKAIAAGDEEERAIDLADQAVIDAQGGGQTKDLASIERGGPALKLFTVFYSFMNTALNIGVAQTMTASSKAKLAADYLLLFVVPPVLGYMLKQALSPGDDSLDDPEKLAKELLAQELDYLMGLMVVVREFAEAAKIITGANDKGRDYTGPAGLRLVSDSVSLAKQAHQGEFDDAFRKAAVNVVGDLFGLPAAQVNRTITGSQALAEGKTSNPAAVVFGYQEKR